MLIEPIYIFFGGWGLASIILSILLIIKIRFTLIKFSWNSFFRFCIGMIISSVVLTISIGLMLSVRENLLFVFLGICMSGGLGLLWFWRLGLVLDWVVILSLFTYQINWGLLYCLINSNKNNG